MLAGDFRRLALGLTGVTEGAHMGHPDFRVAGRIFASLTADETLAMAKLTPEQQARFIEEHPDAFSPASGSWGLQGSTVIRLGSADEDATGEALTLAWQALAERPASTRSGAASRRTGPAVRRTKAEAPASLVDEFIAGCAAEVQPILRKIAAIARKEARGAEEKISYRMPAFFLGGVVIYFAPFKRHIGIFPPVKGDAALEAALAPHRGPKGNLQFPLDRPMPYPLIRRVVQARLKQLAARPATRRARRA